METYDNELYTFLLSNIKIVFKKVFATRWHPLTKKIYNENWSSLSIKDQSIFLVNVVTILSKPAVKVNSLLIGNFILTIY